MRKKILIVERDEDILNVVTTILEDEGYSVIQSGTEFGMIEKIINEKPDVVILDIIKPTSEGTALCNAIKETEATKHIHVIVFSTHPNIDSTPIACADEIIKKPFDVFEMIKIVETRLMA